MDLTAFASPAFYADPYPLYEQLRAKGELLPLPSGLLVTTSHRIVDSLLCDRRMGRAYMQGIRQRYGEHYCNEPAFRVFSQMMLMNNPPQHTRVRTRLMRAFNARQIAELRQWTEEICHELLDAVAADGEAELMQSYCLPLPMRVICRLLDVPYADTLLFSAAADKLVRTMELAPLDSTALAEANTATWQLSDYFQEVLARRRREPGTDLISLLLAPGPDGELEAQDDEELIANLILLFIAGHETTANMLGNSLIALHRHPDQWQLLVAEPDRVPPAVAECLRYDSSVQVGVRVALEDVEVAGHALKRGQIVYLLAGAANRDPAVFERPNELDITRTDSSRLLSFGGGVHFCLGQRLALMELEIGLSTLLQRLPGLQLTGLDQLRWHQRNTLRGVEALWARWQRPQGMP